MARVMCSPEALGDGEIGETVVVGTETRVLTFNVGVSGKSRALTQSKRSLWQSRLVQIRKVYIELLPGAARRYAARHFHSLPMPSQWPTIRMGISNLSFKKRRPNTTLYEATGSRSAVRVFEY